MYQVIIQDEWNNLWHMGFYKNLSDSLDDINSFLNQYGASIDCLEEYPSTFDVCFDKDVEVDDYTSIMIRGFKFNKEVLLNEISA